MPLTPDILCQLVVSVQSPYTTLTGQVRHLVHVYKEHVGVPTARGEGGSSSSSSSSTSGTSTSKKTNFNSNSRSLTGQVRHLVHVHKHQVGVRGGGGGSSTGPVHTPKQRLRDIWRHGSMEFSPQYMLWGEGGGHWR
jgi:hypothetical protein